MAPTAIPATSWGSTVTCTGNTGEARHSPEECCPQQVHIVHNAQIKRHTLALRCGCMLALTQYDCYWGSLTLLAVGHA